MTFHHIGVATANIEKSTALYQSLGYTWQNEALFVDPIQNVQICFMQRVGDPLIELVAPVDATSPINKILEKVRTSPYHTCYEVEDIEATIKELKTKRFVATSKPVSAIAFNNRLICFLYHPHLGLLELLEKAK